MNIDPNSRHVYPLDGLDHETKGTVCWCGPELYRPCSQCEGQGCPFCGEGEWAGWVKVDSPLPGDLLLILHKADDLKG